MSLTRQKGPGRAFLLILAAVIVAWSIYQEFKSDTQVGNLEYRMVTGYHDNSFEVIMIETVKQYTVLDHEFRRIFENNDAEIISRPEQLKLLQKYKDIQYRVNIHHHVTEEKVQYRISREAFNQMKFGSDIKFEIDRKVKDSISTIVEM